jgi:eukaryotic-like serine/threonine-protein kinase
MNPPVRWNCALTAAPTSSPASATSLIKTLKARQRELWLAGQREPAETLLLNHPELATAPEVFSLVYGEFLLCEEVGTTPRLGEFQERFPHFAQQLADQVRMHHVFGASSWQHSSGDTDIRLLDEAMPVPSIPGFEEFKLLGRGGMGVVYRAKQKQLDRHVAIKMMIGGIYAGPNSLHRFRAETEAVAHLDHPGIVPIYEVGEWRGLLYFTMRYVEGGTLSEKLPRLLEDRPRAANLVAQIARALHYAHQRGILHRDLKPSNILIDSEGRPYITDFGLAKRVDRTEAITGSQAFVGTPGYLAPEQVAGEKSITVAVDVWGLGTILYEVLSQQAPYASDTPLRAVQDVLDHDPRRPRSIDASINTDLETICMKCLTREPERRYPSALAVAEDLERWVKGEPIQARKVRSVERVWRWMKRRPAVAGLAGAVVLTTLLGVAGITMAWLYALAGWNHASGESQRVALEQVRTERQRDEAESNLYFSRIAQASFEEKSNNPASAHRLLELCVPREGQPDRRNWEWHYLKGLLHVDLLTIPQPHEEITFDLELSPDGHRLVTAGGSPYRPFPPDRLRLWELWGEKAGQPVAEFAHPRDVHLVRYTADGKRLIWIDDTRQQGVGEIHLVVGDIAQNRIVQKIGLPAKTAVVAISQTGDRYALVDGSGQTQVVDLVSSNTIASFAMGKPMNQMTFSPDGTILALLVQQAIQLKGIGTPVDLKLPINGTGRSRPAFSGDGKLVALGMGGGVVRIWNAVSGQLVQSLSGHDGDVRAVVFSPAGKHLATTGADHTVRLWSIETGEEVLRLRGHQGRGMCLAFHPSGRFLVSGAGQPSEVKVWDLSKQHEYLNVKLPGKRIEALCFSAETGLIQPVRAEGLLQQVDPATGIAQSKSKVDLTASQIRPAVIAACASDGKLLASVSARTNVVKITEVKTGRVLQQVSHKNEIKNLALSPDGKRLVTSTIAMSPGEVREIKVWEVKTGTCLSTVHCDTYLADRTYGPVALSADGRLLVHEEYPANSEAGVLDRTCEVVVRDAASGRVVQKLPGMLPRVERFAFNPKDTLLALSCEKRGVIVYDLAGSKWLHQEPLQGSSNKNSIETFWDMAFSPDGHRLAAVNRMQVLLWDVTSGQRVLTLRGAAPPAGDNGFNPRVAWSPDGRRLAASNADTSFSIWDAGERHSASAKRLMLDGALLRAAGY